MLKVGQSLVRGPFANALGARMSVGAIVGGVIFAAVFLLWVWRIQRGIDLSDEALYLALPVRFALGDRPFLDDRSSYQGMGILTVPLAFVYRLFFRHNDGVVLFFRSCFLIYLGGIGLLVARSVRGWISPMSALACGALAFFYVPYWIAQFSYNTLGGGLTVLAALAALAATRSEAPTYAGRYAMLSGWAAAGAGLCYPTIGLLYPLPLLGLLLFGRPHLSFVQAVVRFVGGSALLGLYVGAFLLRSGFGALKLTYEYIVAWGTLTNATVDTVLAGVEGLKSDWFVSLAIAGGLTAIAARFRPAVFILAGAVPLLAMPIQRSDPSFLLRFFSCAALFAPFFAVLVKDQRFAFRIMMILWGPGLASGFVFAYSSGNGAVAAGLGGFQGLLATALLACRACEESLGTLRRLAHPSVVAPAAFLWILSGSVLSPESVYRDVPPKTAKARVRSGPFRGIYTTVERRNLVEMMHSDIVTESKNSRFVLFLPDMHAGYLSASARPAIPELWLTHSLGRSKINARLFEERLSQVDVVMVRTCGGTANWTRCSPQLPLPKDPLQALVKERFAEEFRRLDYAILRPR